MGRRPRLPRAVVVAGLLTVTVATLQLRSGDASGLPRPGIAGSEATLPIGDLPGWRQTFADDFNQPVPLGSFPDAVSATWTAYPTPWPDSSHHGVYSPADVVSIDNGILDEHIHTAAGVHEVAALLPDAPGPQRGQQYGRFAVRWRADDLPGYKVAWLLWPDSNVWPRDGEIDFPEMNLDSRTVGGFVHRQGANVDNDHWQIKAKMDPNLWHTTVIEWSPGLVVFELDGKEVGRSTVRIPDTPMHWVLQTETRLSGGSPADSVSGHVQVDWVAIWSYDPSITAASAAPAAAAGPALPLAKLPLHVELRRRSGAQ